MIQRTGQGKDFHKALRSLSLYRVLTNLLRCQWMVCKSSLPSYKLEGTSSSNRNNDLVIQDIDSLGLVPPMIGQDTRAKKAASFVTLQHKQMGNA